MERLTNGIAQNPTLQALSVVITIGGFLIFIFKLLVPVIRFAVAWSRDGFKRASVRAVRKTLRRVRRDARNFNLVSTSLAQLGYVSGVAFFLPIVMVIALQGLQNSMEKLKLADPVSAAPSASEIAASAIIGVPLVLAFAWLTFYPSLRFLLYVRLMRRHVLRQLRAKR